MQRRARTTEIPGPTLPPRGGRARTPAAAAVLTATIALAACGGSDGRETSSTGVASLGMTATDSAGTDSMGTADDTAGGVKLDLATNHDTPLGDGCTKVDFLFVIDNSISMEEQQNALKAAFPEFMDTIQNTLPTSDYHIMVVDTDAEGRCSPTECTHETCQEAMQYACGNWFVACDTTRGAGVVHPAGQAATNAPCTLVGTHRYIVEDEPDLASAFECIASVGLAGNASERPMDGMVAAVAEATNAPGGCNDGFLRDDAILVVTFISDDPNIEDLNSPQQTYDAMVAAKNGDPDAIVMLGLIPELPPVCTPADKPDAGAHWAEMIAMFGERGIQGSICSNDYNQFFLDAVSTIEDTCNQFPG